MAFWLLVCKELDGGVYVNRLPQSQSGPIPGVPSAWTYVGPGSNPSVQEYSGNQFILMFEYLSRIITRVFDVTTWPPTQVNPASVSGGPNPPSAIFYGYAPNQGPSDIYVLGFREGENAVAQANNQFSPPYLKANSVIYNPVTDTYSIEVVPDPTWMSNLANTTQYFRLYRSPLGPTPAWTRIQDWQTTLDYTDTTTGTPLQYQYSATIGAYFNPAQPGDPAQHEESSMGAPRSFDATVAPFTFSLLGADTYSLAAGTVPPGASFSYEPGKVGTASMTVRQSFFIQSATDAVHATSGQGVPTSGFSNEGARQAFLVVYASAPSNSASDAMGFGNSASHAYSTGGNAACSVFS